MRRNTSFFWVSDDLRNAGDAYGDDDHGDHVATERGYGYDYDGAPVVDRGLLSLPEGDEQGDANLVRTEARSPTERIAFKGHPRGYGSSCKDDIALPTTSGRRKLFGLSGAGSPRSPSAAEGGAKLRFQVVIWNIGTINVQTGHVKMRFRLTLFWTDDGGGRATTPSPAAARDPSDSDVWVMEGRQRAHRKQWNAIGHESTVKEVIDVPPVSVLNAVDIEAVDGAPEIVMVDERARAMRWTCMYSATLHQGDHLSVRDFPHDAHHIMIKVGVLAHRGRGGRWDHAVYRLGLAGEADSQGSTRVPHGIVVDHCHVPDFGFDPSDLRFQIVPLTSGGGGGEARSDGEDVFLSVTLPVYRQSCYYDTSVLPTLAVLNIIAVTCLTRNFASATAATEIMLSIAFVQVGIRLTLDSRLPSVGYQIKIQKVMNCCFWLLSGLVLESNVVFFLVKKRGWAISTTDKIDIVAAFVALAYNGYIVTTYFRGRRCSPA